jgi:hypothetical protein
MGISPGVRMNPGREHRAEKSAGIPSHFETPRLLWPDVHTCQPRGVLLKAQTRHTVPHAPLAHISRVLVTCACPSPPPAHRTRGFASSAASRIAVACGLLLLGPCGIDPARSRALLSRLDADRCRHTRRSALDGCGRRTCGRRVASRPAGPDRLKRRGNRGRYLLF